MSLMPDTRSLAPDFALDSLLVSAERFITEFCTENQAGPPDSRLREVRRQIGATGTYWHTRAELEFGARVAWRNSARCIGRLYWNSLQVRDRREITAAHDVAAESVTHLREATNGGRIRPVITVFAPDAPGSPGPRILNSQLVRYAGHASVGGAEVTGDPASAGVTRLARDLGWQGGRPPGRFDVLPLVVQAPAACPTLHELPPDAVLEVPIWHPEFGWFADLGLRWYAVPVISDMYLDIGGVCYPAVPFNGWYMCTEIGSRDFGDAGRYDQLPVIARRMGLSTASDRTLWKDRALTELNVAVLHSFSAAGVTIADHHTESTRFLQHVERESRHGRACPADWTWIVPPAASSATPVFHRYYQNFDQTPNFYRHVPLGAQPVVLSASAGVGLPKASRRTGGAPRQVPEQVQCRVVGPVQILDDDDPPAALARPAASAGSRTAPRGPRQPGRSPKAAALPQRQDAAAPRQRAERPGRRPAPPGSRRGQPAQHHLATAQRRERPS